MYCVLLFIRFQFLLSWCLRIVLIIYCFTKKNQDNCFNYFFNCFNYLLFNLTAYLNQPLHFLKQFLAGGRMRVIHSCKAGRNMARNVEQMRKALIILTFQNNFYYFSNYFWFFHWLTAHFLRPSTEWMYTWRRHWSLTEYHHIRYTQEQQSQGRIDDHLLRACGLSMMLISIFF